MMGPTLSELFAFFSSRDFSVNLFANLGGALFGVLLAFWIERSIARRNAGQLYGHILLSVRSELSYLRPQCESVRDRLKARDSAIRQSFSVPVLLEATESRRRQRGEVMAKLEHMEGVGPDIRRALADWQAQTVTLAIRSGAPGAACRQAKPGGRQLLRRILISPITVTPDVEAGRQTGWDYAGEATLGPLVGRVELEIACNSLRIP